MRVVLKSCVLGACDWEVEEGAQLSETGAKAVYGRRQAHQCRTGFLYLPRVMYSNHTSQKVVA